MVFNSLTAAVQIMPVVCVLAVKAPSGLVVLNAGNRNLTVCCDHPPSDPPDGYFITSHPLNNPTAPLLRLNQSSSDAVWLNGSMCFNLGTFTPGETYEVGVVAVRGNHRSKKASIIHTTGERNNKSVQRDLLLFIIVIQTIALSLSVFVYVAPMPVQIAVPVSVGTSYAQLYIQHPQLGLMDGVKVCACPGDWDTVCKGLCSYACDWYSLPAHVHLVNLSNLTPGSQYQLSVHSTSRKQTGPPYYSRLFRTRESSLRALL